MCRTEMYKQVSLQDKLEDHTKIHYFKGFYDDRDAMSDCVRPNWTCSGEYSIEVIKPGETNVTNYSFKVTTDKKAGNWISHLIHQGHFKTFESFDNWLTSFCKSLGTYSEVNGSKRGIITYELWEKHNKH